MLFMSPLLIMILLVVVALQSGQFHTNFHSLDALLGIEPLPSLIQNTPFQRCGVQIIGSLDAQIDDIVCNAPLGVELDNPP